MDLSLLRNQMPEHNISLKKYKRIAKWLNSLSEDELAFIDSFIEEIEFELEEMVLEHCDYKESFDVIQRIKNDKSSSSKKR
jgi:phosphoribosylformylglycinamidine (FGAM) synthase-like enzyme